MELGPVCPIRSTNSRTKVIGQRVRLFGEQRAAVAEDDSAGGEVGGESGEEQVE
jgi:hypothetical protein